LAVVVEVLRAFRQAGSLVRMAPAATGRDVLLPLKLSVPSRPKVPGVPPR
jgi:hypothetical protein